MINYYKQTNIDSNGKYVIKEVKEFTFDIIPLEGYAIITHVGGNGRFKFILNDKEYQTEFAKGICTDHDNYGLNKESDKYYCYNDVTFDINIEQSWGKLYIEHPDTDNYWKKVIYCFT